MTSRAGQRRARPVPGRAGTDGLFAVVGPGGARGAAASLLAPRFRHRRSGPPASQRRRAAPHRWHPSPRGSAAGD